MRPSARRVLARFVRADVIGNVHDILRMWEKLLEKFADKEDEFSMVGEARKTLDAISPTLNSQMARGYVDVDPRTLTPDQLDAYHYFRKHYAFYIVFPNMSYESTLRIGVGNLMLALLQQYDLPAPARKKIELYSRFYAKARMNKAKDWAAAAKLFPELLKTYREQYATVKAIADSAKLRGTDVDGDKVLQAGPFKVVNTGGFDQATMEKCARVVEEAAKRLQSKGMGQVCYGEVLVSQSLSKRKVLAFYLSSKDEMFVRADLKGHEKEALRTVLHELGHRLHLRFLKGKEREIQAMYRRIKESQADAMDRAISEALADPTLSPKPGDEFPYKGETLVVERVSYDLKVHMRLPAEPKFKFTVDLLGYLKAKGFSPNVPKASGFITNYAGKDHTENFAEMIAFYCLNELPDEQVAMLVPIIS